MIDAARMMREHDIGMLPVMEENQIVGTLTDRDIVTRGLAEGIGPETPVSRLMTSGVELCYTDDDVEEAAKLMEPIRCASSTIPSSMALTRSMIRSCAIPRMSQQSGCACRSRCSRPFVS